MQLAIYCFPKKYKLLKEEDKIRIRLFRQNNMISRRMTKRHSSVELGLPPVHIQKLIINRSVAIT